MQALSRLIAAISCCFAGACSQPASHTCDPNGEDDCADAATPLAKHCPVKQSGQFLGYPPPSCAVITELTCAFAGPLCPCGGHTTDQYRCVDGGWERVMYGTCAPCGAGVCPPTLPDDGARCSTPYVGVGECWYTDPCPDAGVVVARCHGVWSVPYMCDGGSAADAGEDAGADAAGDIDTEWDADLAD